MLGGSKDRKQRCLRTSWFILQFSPGRDWLWQKQKHDNRKRPESVSLICYHHKSHLWNIFLHLGCCRCKEGLKYLSTAEPKEFNLIQSILHYIKKTSHWRPIIQLLYYTGRYKNRAEWKSNALPHNQWGPGAPKSGQDSMLTEEIFYSSEWVLFCFVLFCFPD